MRAAGATIPISPKNQVALGSSNAEGLPWAGVADEIELNALLLEDDGLSSPVLLVSVDALYVGPKLRDVIEKASGLPPARVLTFASHTHRAPMLDDSKPALGVPDPEHLASVLEITEALVNRLLRSPRTRVSLWAARGAANHSVNRRRWKLFTISTKPTLAQYVNAPNEQGPRDETILTATLRDEAGSPIAIIWNYACHPVASPHGNEVSAHYPGVIREEIRRIEGNPDLPVIFMQGFSGNTRPNGSVRARSVVRRLQRAITGPVFENMDAESYESWSLSLAAVVASCRVKERRVSGSQLSVERIEVDASAFFDSPATTVSFASLAIGSNFVIVATAAEVVAEYAEPVRAMADAPFVCLAGCADTPFGYLPTEKILEEGGYEGGAFGSEFGLGRLLPGIESAARDSFAAVVPRGERSALDSETEQGQEH